MEIGSQNNFAYRPDIDVLRALAVVTVIGFHGFTSSFTSGYLGVDVFFVISGFLITKILIKKFETHQGLKPLFGFWLSRVRRLFPALLMVLSVMLVLGYLCFFPDELQVLGLHSWRSLVYWQNFTLISEIGYFDPQNIKKPLLHLWSLSVEEHFYILWPVLVLMTSFLGRFKIIGLRIMLFFILSASLIFSMRLGAVDPSASFYHSLARFWEIALGALVAVFLPQKSKPLWGIGCLGLLVLCLIIPSDFIAVLPHQILTCSLTALTIFFGFSVKKASLILWLGKISYPLYLWHWCVFSVANIVFQLHLHSFIPTLSLIVLSIALAALTYYYIEKLRYAKNGLRVCLFWSVGLFVIAFLFYKLDGLPNRPHLDYVRDYGLQQVRHDKRDEACINLVGAPKFLYCRFDNQGFEKTIAIIGDSHAHVLFPGMAKIAKAHGYNSLMLANSSCPTLPGFEWSSKKVSRESCQDSIAQILGVIKDNADIEKVIIATRGPVYIHGETAKPHTRESVIAALNNFRDPKRYSYEKFGAGLAAVAKKLPHISQKNLFYLLENPELDFSPADSLPRPFVKTHNKFVSRELYDLRMENYNETIRTASQNYITLLNPRDVMCDEKQCKFFDIRLLYADDDHFSEYGGYYVLSHFEDKIFGHVK